MSCSDQLQALGLHIDVIDEKLRVRPQDLITPEIREYIRLNKKAIIEELVDSFPQAIDAIKMYLPPLDADVWFCADEKAKAGVQHEELACFLYEDLEYIHQGKPGAESLGRLFEVYAKRHPVTNEIMKAFNGKITSVKLKNSLKSATDQKVSA